LASKVTYRVDPDDPYPKVLRGHIRARLTDGRVVEERQPYLRGGANEPLGEADLVRKFHGNCEFGGWGAEQTARLLAFCTSSYTGALDLEAFRG
jgi:hypothetical protein